MESTEAGGSGPDGTELRFGCASFNQDSTSLALGTRTGYKLFSLTMLEKLDCIHESAETPDVYIVERLFSSSLVVVVSSAMSERMNIYHFKKGTEICNYSYPDNILAVKLNRQRLVVCLEESIYIHNIKDMKLLKTLLNTPSNPSGLCALSITHSNSYLAYPGSSSTGEVIVYDTISLNTVTVIPAHDSPLAALTFNASATRLASASERVRRRVTHLHRSAEEQLGFSYRPAEERLGFSDRPAEERLGFSDRPAETHIIVTNMRSELVPEF